MGKYRPGRNPPSEIYSVNVRKFTNAADTYSSRHNKRNGFYDPITANLVCTGDLTF